MELDKRQKRHIKVARRGKLNSTLFFFFAVSLSRLREVYDFSGAFKTPHWGTAPGIKGRNRDDWFPLVRKNVFFVGEKKSQNLNT